MELILVIIAGITGTVLMTGFSLLLSRLRSKQFREPRLLNIILRRSTHEPMNPSNDSILGWVVHFSIGVILMTLFYMFHIIFLFSISSLSIIIFGLITGGLAIISWQLMFYISRRPPEIDFREFYVQIFIAHLIFAMGAFVLMI
ncbi:hypothetical protein MKO06_03050 [Gramella sp. GC03-9]|uniref:DUF2938 domain-containing protein n=1 Tax=Christiangramia oceanisediminis TaxID=2920386 RepID=A0A9X2KVW8_9FLAO|nr:hypothetical protein [Gramella oceanisediminis]MCP9198868.1 hypothetical protein [Gramella oceanisediminis]